MSTVFSGRFDGRVIVPDQPLQLPIGETLQVHVEPLAEQAGRAADLGRLAADLPDSPGNLSEQRPVKLPIFDYDGPPDIDLTNAKSKCDGKGYCRAT